MMMSYEEARAKALQAAVTLNSGALSLDSDLHEKDACFVSKVCMIAEVFVEYIKDGTVAGMSVHPLGIQENE